ncbi:glycine-rich domain-containing protein [Microbulbifer sp. SSSA002]|uniref:glycine-rich domain-containing protein n=1 Tax=Microbulbifer sp. SSSA002 TaxID=3243376 RepID=UPI004039124E
MTFEVFVAAGLAVGLLVLSIVIFFFYRRSVRNRLASTQVRFVKEYQFHPSIKRRVKKQYPHLNAQQLNTVIDGLRDYFLICQTAGKKMVAMPSQVVDAAWHEFILSTRLYDDFCQKSFGRFLHHTPNEVMPSKNSPSEGIKRAWRIACAHSKIDPSRPDSLPLIFSIDKKLKIKDGFHYSLNCRSKKNSGKDYCASHMGCASDCAGDMDSDGLWRSDYSADSDGSSYNSSSSDTSSSSSSDSSSSSSYSSSSSGSGSSCSSGSGSSCGSSCGGGGD